MTTEGSTAFPQGARSTRTSSASHLISVETRPWEGVPRKTRPGRAVVTGEPEEPCSPHEVKKQPPASDTWAQQGEQVERELWPLHTPGARAGQDPVLG